MEHFMMAVSVVLPMLIYMVVGKIIDKLGILKLEHFEAMNRMVFRIFIPLTLFFNVYDVDLKSSVNPMMFVFVFLTVTFVYIVTWITVSKAVKEERDASTIIQGIYRSNYVLFGNYIAMSLGGQEALAVVAALAALTVPLFNVLAVALFEIKCGGNINVVQIIVNIFKNPLVDAGLLGCVFSLCSISIPQLIEEPLKNLGDIATPLALVTLGGMLSMKSINSHKVYLTWSVLGRLVIVPVLMIAFAVSIGIRGDDLIAVLAIFASPTAVASAPMAQSMGGNGMLASEIVALTSGLCILTLFVFVFTLLRFGLI